MMAWIGAKIDCFHFAVIASNVFVVIRAKLFSVLVDVSLKGQKEPPQNAASSLIYFQPQKGLAGKIAANLVG